MHARDQQREVRLRALRERQEAIDRGLFRPDTAKSAASFERARAAADLSGGLHQQHDSSLCASECSGAGGATVSQAAHSRLNRSHTAAYQQSLLPPATSDPECTFQPNLHRPCSSRPTRAQIEEVGDALYKDAHNRAIRRKMLEAQADAELAEQRAKPKISKESDQYALRRLEREVDDIYAALERTGEGLTYEEFGAAMVELGFLRYVDADTAISAADTESGSSQRRRATHGKAAAHAQEEVLMIQRVWAALVGFTTPGATLSARKLLRFLTCALSSAPDKGSVSDDSDEEDGDGDKPSEDMRSLCL